MSSLKNHDTSIVPEYPALIYDGDCGFCIRWISNLQRVTKGLRYYPYQDVHTHIEVASEADFEKALHYIDDKGKVKTGAGAVSAALGFAGLGWIGAVLQFGPFKALADAGYSFVAGRRKQLSKLSNRLYGKQKVSVTHDYAKQGFFYGLAAVYMLAFWSLAIQAIPLYGKRGILPIHEAMDMLSNMFSGFGFFQYPTLFWFTSGDWFLYLVCAIGTVAGGLIAYKKTRIPALIMAWFCYISFINVGAPFLSFQWDVLLVEVGFLAIFLAMPSWAISWVAHWMLKWTLFRVMFGSGLVKLVSGDSLWHGLKALHVHYWTQPLPHFGGWFMHQLPGFVHTLSTLLMFGIELLVPFLIFAPRKLRLYAVPPLVGLQLMIMLTGNYGFFNILNIVLCVLLLDDAVIYKVKRVVVNTKGRKKDENPVVAHVGTGVGIFVLALIFLASLSLETRRFMNVDFVPKAMHKLVSGWHVAHPYGLFAVMTNDRIEIELEATADGETWYRFPTRYKPSHAKGMPGWVQPYMPRLDWQFWFASKQEKPPVWMYRLIREMFTNNPNVLRLYKQKPFKGEYPIALRIRYHRMTFTDFGTLASTGEWWTVEQDIRPPILIKP